MADRASQHSPIEPPPDGGGSADGGGSTDGGGSADDNSSADGGGKADGGGSADSGGSADVDSSANGGGSTRILLVHGLGRTPRSLASLARHLRQSDHEVHQCGYFAATQSVEQIVRRVHARMAELTSPTRPFAIVAHSLGGILVRAALALDPPLPAPPHHLVMLGPPNQPPRLAKRLQRNWIYRAINGEAGQRLADPAFLAELPPPTIPHTIIAGTGGPTGRWSPFGQDPNDSIVAVSETRCTAEGPITELPVRHTFMMNDPRVRAVIDEVLAHMKPASPGTPDKREPR